jgi:hypothetical protein
LGVLQQNLQTLGKEAGVMLNVLIGLVVKNCCERIAGNTSEEDVRNEMMGLIEE